MAEDENLESKLEPHQEVFRVGRADKRFENDFMIGDLYYDFKSRKFGIERDWGYVVEISGFTGEELIRRLAEEYIKNIEYYRDNNDKSKK